MRKIRRDKSLSEDQVALLAAEKVTPVLSHDRDSTHSPSGDGVQAQDLDVVPDIGREEPHRRKEDAQHSTLRHGEVPGLGKTVEVKIISSYSIFEYFSLMARMRRNPRSQILTDPTQSSSSSAVSQSCSIFEYFSSMARMRRNPRSQILTDPTQSSSSTAVSQTSVRCP